MTESEKRARAIQRAREEHVHILRVHNRPNVYTTLSKSRERARYILFVEPDGSVACSCRGFYNHKVCKHSEQLHTRLAREAAEQRRAEARGRRAGDPAQLAMPLDGESARPAA
jgi:hypothetical protein